jgi:hypothetical protein
MCPWQWQDLPCALFIFLVKIMKNGGINVNRKKTKEKIDNNVVAPGIDETDAYGRDATEEEVAHGESIKVTRLVYDEYDPSEG